MTKRYLVVTVMLLAMAISAMAVDWSAFVIRNSSAGIAPSITDISGGKLFAITLSGQKAGWSTNDMNGKKVGDITAMSITRDPSVTGWGPYMNFWVTDVDGNYAVLSNEPSHTWEYTGSSPYNTTWDVLKNATCWVYEVSPITGFKLPNGTMTYVNLPAGTAPAPKFSDFAGYTIATPPVHWGGPGAPDDLNAGSYTAYGFNWVFGDTQSNYVNGYLVSNPFITSPKTYKVTPNMLTIGDTRWGVDSSISPFGPLSANGAPAGFGTSSFTATVNESGPAAADAYRSLRLIPEAIFGHIVKLSDIASMSYMTKNIDSTIDWRYTIYTKKTLSNDVGWYHSRLSGSFGNTPNDWKTWSTDSLTFDSRRNYPPTESYGQTWSTVTSADPTDVVLFFDIILGANPNSGGGTGTSQLDAVKITLKNGEVAILDLEQDATLSLDAPSASLYVKTNESFVIDMNVKDLPTEVKGCQALLGYDDAMLNAGSVAVGGGVWDQLISETWSIVGAQGKINTAIGVNSDSSAGTSAPGTVAKITLIAGSTDGSTQLVFLPNVSDVEDTRLADMFGNSIFPTKVNSTNIIIDGTAPTVVLSDDHADAIVRDADTVVITATFTDATGIDETTNPPKITIAGGGVTDGLMTKSSNLVWTYSWNVPAGNDGTATVSISAFDMAGNPNVSATGKTAYTIDNIAPTATLSVTQFGLPIGTAIQGAVDIAVTAINGTGTTGSVKSVTVTGPPTLPVTGTYSVTIGSSTPNGLYTVTAIVTDQAGNETTKTATFTVNKNEISGTVAMDFVGTGTRVVTFVLNGTTTMTADVDSGGAYKLTNVPDDITAVSAKTAWTLRRKITVSATNGQITANFMGAAKLLAGDINGTNSININDYSLLKAKWYTTDLAADVNGDGVVQGEDYILMKSSWFKLGDAF